MTLILKIDLDMVKISGRSRIFCWGGGHQASGWHQPPMWALFGEKVCEMKELDMLAAPPPHGSANEDAPPVVDPGFPIGWHAPIRGVVDLQRGHFLVKIYAKTKELGPIGGCVPGMPPLPLDPPMTTMPKIKFLGQCIQKL